MTNQLYNSLADSESCNYKIVQAWLKEHFRLKLKNQENTNMADRMRKKKTTSVKLTAEEVQKFKALLLAKRKEILGDVSHMENETLRKSRSDLSNMPIHMADVGTDNFEQEFTLGLVDSERKVLVEIEEALRRIEEGTYGICEGNGQFIEKERLEAIPWTRYCVAYASQMEKGLAQKQETEELDYGDEADEEPEQNQE